MFGRVKWTLIQGVGMTFVCCVRADVRVYKDLLLPKYKIKYIKILPMHSCLYFNHIMSFEFSSYRHIITRIKLEDLQYITHFKRILKPNESY